MAIIPTVLYYLSIVLMVETDVKRLDAAVGLAQRSVGA